MLVFVVNIIKTARTGARAGQRPVARRHARVVHDLAAAAMELRPRPVHHQRRGRCATCAAGSRRRDGCDRRALGAAARGGRASPATALAVVSGAADWHTAHRAARRGRAAAARSGSSSLALAARRAGSCRPRSPRSSLFGAAALLTGRDLHLALAALALRRDGACSRAQAFRGEPGPAGEPARLRDADEAAGDVAAAPDRRRGDLRRRRRASRPCGTFAATMVGLALACGGAATLNHYLDRDIDKLMGERTAGRPVASGRVAPERALEFGIALSALSFVLLDSLVNLPTALLALARQPLLRPRLHPLAEALDAAEHRDRRRRRRRAAARRVRGGDRPPRLGGARRCSGSSSSGRRRTSGRSR